MLSETLGLNVKTLGYFSLFTNASYALSLPFWGALVHYYGISRVHLLLAVACASWGFATIGIAVVGYSIVGQAIFRAIVGAALGSIMPLSQTLLVELTPVEMRGRAFGLMLLCENLAGTLASAAVVYSDVWETSYYALGTGSIVMGYLSWIVLSPSQKSPVRIMPNDDEKSRAGRNSASMLHSTKTESEYHPKLTLRQIVHRIVKMPAFLCMVAQGVFGGTPWDMMSFLLLLMNWRGFAKHEMLMIQFTSGLTSTIGGWLGGFLGDYAAGRWGPLGRIWLAFGSVLGGIPLYGMHLFATDYIGALLWMNAFQLWGTWTQAGALRPICADLTRNASERAQIISLWIVLEKMSGALFGAPLVGYLTNNMLTATSVPPIESVETTTANVESEKAHALAFNLFLLSSLFWGICAFFWALMSVATQRNNEPMSISNEVMMIEKLVRQDSLSSSSTGSFGARQRSMAK
jgi:Major Facilitator Superfamily